MSGTHSIQTFIAEDEPYQRDILVEYVLARSELVLKGTAESGDEALEKIRTNCYDLLFLDINMPALSGIEILERLECAPCAIFTTAYDEFAVKAFELGALDYLLKPFDQSRFDCAVDRALQIIDRNLTVSFSAQRIGLSCRDGESYYLIPYEDIIYISSHARQTVIHTTRKAIKINRLMKDIAENLPEKLFTRIHKQYIINFRFFSHYKYYSGGNYVLFMSDEEKTTLPMGRKYYNELKARFGV